MQHQQKILDILKKPYQLDEQTLPVLQKLTAEYPYCQSLQILLAKNLQTFDKLDFEKQVNKASAYAIDRRKFQRYISDRDKPVDIKEQIARIHEAEKSAQHTLPQTTADIITPATSQVQPEEVILQDPPVKVPEKIPPGAPTELPPELPGGLPDDVPQPAPTEVPTQLPSEAPGTFPADVPPGKADQSIEPAQVSKPVESPKADVREVTTSKAGTTVKSPASLPSTQNGKATGGGFWPRLLRKLNLFQPDIAKQPASIEKIKPGEGPSKKENVEVRKKEPLAKTQTKPTASAPEVKETPQVNTAEPEKAPVVSKATLPTSQNNPVTGSNAPRADNHQPTINRGFTEHEKQAQKPDINFLIEKFLKEEPRIQINKEALPDRQEDLSEPSTHEDPQLVSETLAQIFHKQGNKVKALDIYEKLCLKFPEKSSYFAKKIIDIKNEFNT